VSAPLLLLALACGDVDPSGEAAERALVSPPEDPAEALEACASSAFEQLQVLCRVEVAAQAGREAMPAVVERACAGLPEGTWRHECHFRAGEELSRGGLPVQALAHCARAGRFQRFCVTHAGWALPPRPELDADQPVAALIPAMDAELAAIAQATEALEAEAQPEALDTFRMRLWFNAYYGTGSAHPRAAKAADASQAHQARSAWAMEAARLLAPAGAPPPPDAVARMLEGWYDSDPFVGDPLPPQRRHGRYTTPLPVPCERDLEPVPLYGGGRRIRGLNIEEDLVIAALEGLFFRPETPAEIFEPWVHDPRQRVRWTAARLLRTSQPGSMDMEATLRRLSEHRDECVAWNARDGLEHRTWEREPGGYR
jgi:hypothetical protein